MTKVIKHPIFSVNYSYSKGKNDVKKGFFYENPQPAKGIITFSKNINLKDKKVFFVPGCKLRRHAFRSLFPDSKIVTKITNADAVISDYEVFSYTPSNVKLFTWDSSFSFIGNSYGSNLNKIKAIYEDLNKNKVFPAKYIDGNGWRQDLNQDGQKLLREKVLCGFLESEFKLQKIFTYLHNNKIPLYRSEDVLNHVSTDPVKADFNILRQSILMCLSSDNDSKETGSDNIFSLGPEYNGLKYILYNLVASNCKGKFINTFREVNSRFFGRASFPNPKLLTDDNFYKSLFENKNYKCFLNTTQEAQDLTSRILNDGDIQKRLLGNNGSLYVTNFSIELPRIEPLPISEGEYEEEDSTLSDESWKI